MARTIEQTELEIERLVNRLERRLGQIVNRRLGRIRELDGIELQAEIAALPSSALNDLEYQTALAALTVVYGLELKDALARTSSAVGEAVLATEDDLRSASLIVAAETNQVNTVTTGYLNNLQRQVLTSEIAPGLVNLDEFRETFEASTFNTITTELNTDVISYNSTMNVKKGLESGITLFVYRGPDDIKNRPFCDHLQGQTTREFSGMPSRRSRVYSIDEIMLMDNGQRAPVLSYRGGYNCRHVWSSVNEKRARSLGWPTR
jgi:hypothetical protein